MVNLGYSFHGLMIHISISMDGLCHQTFFKPFGTSTMITNLRYPSTWQWRHSKMAVPQGSEHGTSGQALGDAVGIMLLEGAFFGTQTYHPMLYVLRIFKG